MRALLTALVAVGFALLGLSGGVTAEEPGGAPDAAAAPYRIDPVHSSVWFQIRHLGISTFYGRFNDVSGDFAVHDGGACSVVVRSDSVDTNHGERDGHLRGPDFLAAKEFPEISFRSASIENAPGDLLRVEGVLTLRGVSRRLSVWARREGAGRGPAGEKRVGVESTFTIRRADYGMEWRPDVLGDEITVTVALEGVAR